MSKDPQHIDRRLPLVMAILVGLFCYYTWSPDSPFKVPQVLPLEQALSHTLQGPSQGKIRLLTSHKTSANHYKLQAVTSGDSALNLEILAKLPEPPAINSLWWVKGELHWQANRAVLDTLIAQGCISKLDESPVNCADAK